MVPPRVGNLMMNERQLVNEVLVLDNNGLLPSPVSYAQVEPSRLPVTARALRNCGYREMQYRWMHIPTGKSGLPTLWVGAERWAGVLVEFWNRVGGPVWKYSLA